jgi:serine phosphatase RsbU (regulator of sigma subunit)
LYNDQGEYNKALIFYKKTEKVAQQIGSSNTLAACYNNMGLLHQEQGNNTKALANFLKSLKIKEQTKNQRGIAKTLHNLGTVCKGQKDYSQAQNYYFKSLKIELKLKNNRGTVNCYNSIASVYQLQQNYTLARAYFEKAKLLAEEQVLKKLLANSYEGLGQVALEQKNYPRAKTHLLQSLQIREEIGAKGEQVSVQVSLGKLAYQQGQYTKALTYLNKAIALGQKIKVREGVCNGAELRAKVYAALGKFDKAYQDHQLFKSLADSLFNKEKTRKIANMEAEYAFSKKEDSLRVVQQKKQLAFDADIKTRQATQQATYIGLGLTALLLVVLSFFFFDKQKSNKRLSESNNKLASVNQVLKQQQQKILNQHNAIEGKNMALEKANTVLKTQKEEIKTQSDAIERQNEALLFANSQINKSIQAAKFIQAAVLPFDKRMQAHFDEFFVLFRPRDVVSGDFYWLGHLHNQTVLMAIDCTGHGVPGAFMSMMAHTFLNQVVNIQQITQPRLILEALRYEIGLYMVDETTSTVLGLDAAAVTIQYQGRHTRVLFTGAKRPLMWIEPKRTKIQEVLGSSISIGRVYQKKRAFVQEEFLLPKGTVLYMGSDGLEDQNNLKRQKFTKARLKSLLETHSQVPLAQQRQAIAQALDEHMQDTEQRDDILLIGVRV